MGARTCKDFVQSKEFIREFLGRLIHMEELSLDVYLASNCEFWSQKLPGTSGSLVSNIEL